MPSGSRLVRVGPEACRRVQAPKLPEPSGSTRTKAAPVRLFRGISAWQALQPSKSVRAWCSFPSHRVCPAMHFSCVTPKRLLAVALVRAWNGRMEGLLRDMQFEVVSGGTSGGFLGF